MSNADKNDPVRWPSALAAAGQGRKVIGIIGSAVPVELVLAAGAFPCGVAARQQDFGQTAYPMESELGSEVLSLFRQALDGAFDRFDGLVIASTADGYRYLFQYLAEMRRSGKCPSLPPVHLYDFLLGDGAPVADYNQAVVARFTRWLESLTGQRVNDARLEAAIEEVNQQRRALEAVHALRLQGHIRGSAALGAISAGRLPPPDDTGAILSAPRLLLATATSLYHNQLHLLIEAAGGNVVAEDDPAGSRRLGPPITPEGDPVARLIAHYRDHDASPRQVAPRRDIWLRGMMAEPAVDGVIFYLSPDDQSWGWRYPDLADCARRAGKPSLLLRDEALSEQSAQGLTSAVSAWLAGMRKEPAA